MDNFSAWLRVDCCAAMLIRRRATTTAADDGARMDMWGALQYVGTGLSLVAFAVTAI